MKNNITKNELERRAASLLLFMDATHALGRFVGNEPYSLTRDGRTVNVVFRGQRASVAFSRKQLDRFPFHGDFRDLDIGVSHGLSLFHQLVDQIVEIDHETEQAKNIGTDSEERREKELHQAISSSDSEEPEHHL